MARHNGKSCLPSPSRQTTNVWRFFGEKSCIGNRKICEPERKARRRWRHGAEKRRIYMCVYGQKFGKKKWKKKVKISQAEVLPTGFQTHWFLIRTGNLIYCCKRLSKNWTVLCRACSPDLTRTLPTRREWYSTDVTASPLFRSFPIPSRRDRWLSGVPFSPDLRSRTLWTLSRNSPVFISPFSNRCQIIIPTFDSGVDTRLTKYSAKSSELTLARVSSLRGKWDFEIFVKYINLPSSLSN